MNRKRFALLATTVAVLAGAGGVAAVVRSDSAPPGPPAWVNPDGTVDARKMPVFLEVAGPDGEPVVCANGRTLKVPRELLVGPPDATPDKLRARGVSDPSIYVWRCGAGPNGDRRPVRVPLDE